jgi:hypothetical protein
VRVGFAGLFVGVGMGAVIALLSILLPNAPVWLLSAISVFLFFGLVVVALVLFNTPGGWRRKKIDPEIVAKELQAQNLLTVETFKARRAFQVEEFEDEGAHYFLELEDGSVLFLSGQYLYEYEPVEKRHELVQQRRFPNAAFAIRRHTVKRYVVDILCSGSVIEPEVMAPAFDTDDFGTNRIPSDGQIFVDRSFEDLKSSRLKGALR